MRDHEGIELFALPHAEAQRLLATGVPVVLTVNPVEYHGPHLPLHNDRLLSRGLARDLMARLGHPLVLGADLEIGVEPCPGPGTRACAYDSVRRQVVAACDALVELGARRVVIMSFHGAPLHSLALHAGVEALRARGVPALAPMDVLLAEMLTIDDVRAYDDVLAPVPAREREALARELPHDFHAGFFETSLTLHYAPASVSAVHRELPPCPAVAPDRRLAAAARTARLLGRTTLARELDFAAVGAAWYALRPFPGYTGRPALANPDSGAALARRIVDGYETAAHAVLDHGAPPPAPIMPWLARLSANGRIGVPLPSLGEIRTFGARAGA